MKRITAILLVLVMILTLSACGHKHVWKQATATEPKTCTICGATEGEALGYAWGEIEYEWAEDGSLIAKRVSGTDPAIVETETATVTAEVTKEPTFEEPGETTYTASFENPDFPVQTRTVADIPPLDYEWGEPEFEWAEDGSLVAKRVSGADPSIVETETATVTAEVTKEPTFEEPGETTYTASFENPGFPVQTRTVADIPPRDYEWGEPSFEWTADGGLIAKRVSGADPSIVQTEVATVTSEVTKEPTYDEPGETTYTASFENPDFTVQVRTIPDIEPLSYEWGDIRFDWTEDGGLIATRISGADPSIVETETATVTSEVTKEPTFDEPGETTYTASFENPDFPVQVRTVADIPPLSREWSEPEFEWTEDGTVIAKRVSGSDPSIVETESAAVITAEVTKEPTYDEPGETTYTASFENPAFPVQTRTVADIPPLSEGWSEPEFEWTEDGGLIAKRVSGADPSIVETETATVTAEVTKEPTFEEPGETTYTASFENPAFPVQTRTVADIPPLDYEWSEPEIEWTEDGIAIAKRVSGVDPSIVETESAAFITAEVTKEPTFEEPGETTYTASFENPAFPVQTRTVADIPPRDYEWGEPEIEWAEDGSAIAKRVSGADPSIVETESATVTAEVTREPACEEPGETTYTASFENPAFPVQTRTVDDIEALGHDWIAATHLQPQTCAVCGKTEGEPLPIQYVDESFARFRRDFNQIYAGFMKILPEEGEGFVLKVGGASMYTQGMDETIRFYHGDEFAPGDETAVQELEDFNLLRIRYVAPTADFDTSLSARVWELGGYTARILDPEVSEDDFLHGVDLFSAKGQTQSFVHNGYVYTLSCAPDGDSAYVYDFLLTLESNLE